MKKWIVFAVILLSAACVQSAMPTLEKVHAMKKPGTYEEYLNNIRTLLIFQKEYFQEALDSLTAAKKNSKTDAEFAAAKEPIDKAIYEYTMLFSDKNREQMEYAKSLDGVTAQKVYTELAQYYRDSEAVILQYNQFMVSGTNQGYPSQEVLKKPGTPK
ncbi:MAG: hypothetical protein A2Y33_14125 [Spirochaetes bacterium GWF1_51_8]|nr:MAG: hypothetical protein A2Y33_14125 [Spirochaetes bacterium GWF1_51_8]